MKNIKHIIIIALLSFSVKGFSQVIIGGETGSAGSNTTSVLLDFPTDKNKGIILPYVRIVPSLPTVGTLILDASTPENAKVKYYNGSWQDLSGDRAIVTTSGSSLNTATVINAALKDQPKDVTEATKSKVIIGNHDTTADGVLVLESNTKAMVLPIVEDVTKILSPSPGMMVYVTGVTPYYNKRLAVFNGSKWTFWKP